MESLNIEKFNPNKVELIKLANSYKELKINGIDDKEGYLTVHNARINLKKTRVIITKTGKDLRTEAIQFQKAVIIKEKELIEIIEPIEKDLEKKEKMIDEKKEKTLRVSLLPRRIRMLEEFNVKIDDDELLSLNENEFVILYGDSKNKFLEEKEKKIQEEQEKLAIDKKKLEDEKKIEEAKKEAEKESTEKALRDAELAKIKAEEDKKKAVEAEKLKAEQEKQKLIDEQNKKEQERINAENEKKQKEQEKIQKEKDEQERIEKQNKYKKFLKDNGYTDDNKDNFYVQKNDNKITLFKKVGEFIIN